MSAGNSQKSSHSVVERYRLDSEIHDFVMDPGENQAVMLSSEPQGLPEPEFPLHPPDGKEPSRLSYHWHNGWRAFRRWLVPYIRSRMRGAEFRPLLSYLFTDYKCNLDCHYCWAYNNRIPGMTEDVARRSIDWLHSTGCRVIALMGGEPLLRPKFIHKIVYYGAKRDFFVYLPTNGRLMKPEVIDWIGDAGVAAINLAVDALDEKPGLPKALNPIRRNFEYLVQAQRRYGYMVVFNINICRNNLEDVKALTEIAHDNGISTDYHINETPMIEQGHFKHYEENPTYIYPEHWPLIDDLLDYLIEKNRSGYIMVNSKAHLAAMKRFMRGESMGRWNCRAGRNSLVIRTDGTLAPCFPMYSAKRDWGIVGNPKFDWNQLEIMKDRCTHHCLSTCQYVLGYYYDNAHVLRWIIKQALHGFQGISAAQTQN